MQKVNHDTVIDKMKSIYIILKKMLTKSKNSIKNKIKHNKQWIHLYQLSVVACAFWVYNINIVNSIYLYAYTFTI